MIGFTKSAKIKSTPTKINTNQTPYANGMITSLFPVVRGYVLYTNDTLTLAGFESIRSIHSFYYFSTLKNLKQGLLDLGGEIHPNINPDKFSFLDIV